MKTILFLDDEDSILNTYKRTIHGLGVQAFFANNSIDAFLIYKSEKIDLIISDYRLKEETGLEFLKRIRKTDFDIPMIIVSGYADENLITHALEEKIIQEYLIKPVPLNQFLSLIKKFTTP